MYFHISLCSTRDIILVVSTRYTYIYIYMYIRLVAISSCIHIKSICAYISCRRATNFLLYKIYCFVQVLLLLRIVAIYSKYIIQNRKTFEKFPYPPRKNLLLLAIFSLIQLWPNPMHYDITLYKISKYETARDRKSCLFSLWGYIIVIFQ